MSERYQKQTGWEKYRTVEWDGTTQPPPGIMIDERVRILISKSEGDSK